MKTATHAITPQSRISFGERYEMAAQRELYQKLLMKHRLKGRVVFSEQAEMEEQRKWFATQMAALQGRGKK